MLTAFLIAAALGGTAIDGASGQVAVVARAQAPVEAAREGEPTTRRVCRLERATGSNLQQRVCRDIPRQGVQDQQTREFMRFHQRIRLPDETGGPGPGG